MSLPDLHGYWKYGDVVVPFRLPLAPVRVVGKGFIKRAESLALTSQNDAGTPPSTKIETSERDRLREQQVSPAKPRQEETAPRQQTFQYVMADAIAEKSPTPEVSPRYAVESESVDQTDVDVAPEHEYTGQLGPC